MMIKFMQFFYKDFSRKTNDRLDAFDRDYGKHLQDEHRRQKKVCLLNEECMGNTSALFNPWRMHKGITCSGPLSMSL